MTAVVLRLSGPLQSWGVASRHKTRDTRAEPTRSGVVGLVANALGRDRSDDISDLSALRFGVRTERPGTVLRDYHTAAEADGSTIVTERYYLADAAFTAVLEGDAGLVGQVAQALRHPARPLFLGRRSCPPDAPVFDRVGDESLESILESPDVSEHTWSRDALPGEPGSVLRDVPVSFDPDLRRHTVRKVTTGRTAASSTQGGLSGFFEAVEV